MSVGSGSLVDEGGLLPAWQDGRIGQAILHVLVSLHAALHAGEERQIAAFLSTNAARLLDGQGLLKRR